MAKRNYPKMRCMYCGTLITRNTKHSCGDNTDRNCTPAVAKLLANVTRFYYCVPCRMIREANSGTVQICNLCGRTMTT